MVRFKRKKKTHRRVRQLPAEAPPTETPEDTSEADEEEEEQEEAAEVARVHDDGEEEDNYRHPMIRSSYITILFLSLHSGFLSIIIFCFIELTTWHNRSSRATALKEKNAKNMRDPPMSEILKDTMKYRMEIEELEECNHNLTLLTYANLGIEFTVMSHSSMLLDMDRRYIYPFAQLVLYLFSRVHHVVFDDIYGRFFGPEDILGGLLIEIFYVCYGRNRPDSVLPSLNHFMPSPLLLLIFPLMVAIVQVYAIYRHEIVYKKERNIRKKIRDRYVNGTPPNLYDSIF